MFGKRLINEYSVVDNAEETLIVVTNLDNEFDPKFHGAFISVGKEASLVSQPYVIALYELGAIKEKSATFAYDTCLN